MQYVSPSTLSLINESASYSMSGGCWLEYNMNDLILGAKVRGPNGTDENPEGTLQITQTVNGKTYYPYKKLFPLTNIIDPRRPSSAGISYFLLNKMAPVAIPKYNVSKELPSRLYFASAKNQYKYFLAGPAENLSLPNCNINVEYPVLKTAVANVIVVKFETSYSKPVSWSIKIKNHQDVEATIFTNTVVSSSNTGVFELYYNGGLWSSPSSWSTTKFTTPSIPVDIKNITVTVSTINKANSYLGVIEIGAKYIQDVSDRVISFQASKMSSDSSSGIVPVGSVTSNALSLSLEGFDKKGIEYDKTYAFNKNNINLYKNVKMIPFNKIGSDMIFQGVFYIDSFSISEFGDIDIQGLDGAKFLQEILAPDIVIQNAPSQAIIRRLLDGIGFTSYNFNTYAKDSTDLTDTATIVPLFWYTEDTKTVWEHIQDLCRDTQMIATFDNNDILQFYPRDYLFDKTRGTNFKFRSEKKLLNLPNIMSMSKETVPSVKAVKVIYSPIISTNYSGSSDNLYVSPPSAIGAAALQSTLLATPPVTVDAPLGVVTLAPISVYSSLADTSFYNKSGYFLINNEIIKYDAIEFQYEPVSAPNTLVKKWITSDSDIAKWLGESKIGSFKSTLRYRIKERNSFNATGKGVGVGEEHKVEINKLKEEWFGSRLNLSAKTNVGDQSVFTLKQTEKQSEGPVVKEVEVSRSLLHIVTPPASKEYYCASITPDTVNISTEEYFSVGTALFFKLAKDKFGRVTGEQAVSAALGIGLDSNNLNGYILKISTSQNVATKGLESKDVQLWKIVDGKETKITDTQKTEDNSITGVSGGKFYRIDVKVSKATTGKKIFKIKFNNQLITATDESPIAINSKISLIGIEGEAAFDYAYCSSLTKNEFNSSTSYDNYGSYISASNALQNLFGDFVFTGSNSSSKAPWIKEFGPVAREIKKISTKYSTRPGLVKYPQIILNPNVTLIGYNANSFGIEAYILNNTGAFVDIADGGEKSFIVVGETITTLDPFEYIDPLLSSTKNEEQVAFESTWIQKEEEAKKLSEWMRTQWSNQQIVLTLDIFPNPILEIGDIVEISYPNNSVYSTEDTGKTAGKYIVLDIEQAYSSDPSTRITCRSIYV
jgi:hypothetical protein